MIRYTHFFSTHAGFFAAFGTEGGSVSSVDYFGAVNKADGEKYQYNCNRYGNPYDIGFGPMVTAGGVYRLDFGDCALRARAGLGYGLIVYNSLTYTRELKSAGTDSGPTYIYFHTTDAKSAQDYLRDGSYTYRNGTPAFVMNASAQFIYKLGKVYFLADLGICGSPSKATCLQVTTGTKQAYNPSNYAEAVAYDSYKGVWVTDENAVSTKTIHQGAGLFLHASFGIGISLGRSNK